MLRELDLILDVNGKPITRLSDMNVQMEEVEMTILREKQEMTVRVRTSVESGYGTNRVVFGRGLFCKVRIGFQWRTPEIIWRV